MLSNEDLIISANEVIDLQITSLQSLKQRIGQEFAEAVRLIDTAGKIITTGVGKSGLIARKVAATLTSIGVPSVFLHPTEALHGDIGIVASTDVVIAFSKSGNTEEIVNLYNVLKSLKVKSISVVGNRESYLGRNATITLDASISKEACPLNLAPTTSTSLALSVGDILAVGIMKLRNFSNEDFARTHPSGQIGRNVTLQVIDVMHGTHRMPIVKPTAKFRDAVIEITQKDLGCVCVVDEDKTLLGLLTDGDVRRVLQKFDDIRTLSVQDVMTKNPIAVEKDTFLGEALTIMENRERQISVLPVIDEYKKCIGIVRIHDILKSN